MNNTNIINIASLQDLEPLVVNLADDELLLLDFWSENCEPCKTLEPLLVNFATKYSPKLKLARVNVDHDQTIAKQFKVQSIPSVKMINKGQLVDQFVGAQGADVIEKMINKILPLPADESALWQAATELMAQGQWDLAQNNIKLLITKEPDHKELPLMLAKCYIGLKHYAEARAIIADYTDLSFKSQCDNMLLVLDTFAKIGSATDNDNELQTTFNLAIENAAKSDFTAAFDGLLDIIRQDKEFCDGQPRKLLVALFDFLGASSEIVKKYRKKLANILFV